MQQNRKQDQDVPSRASNMEKAEGSRERMTNRGSSDADLGTSTDRAMFDDEGDARVPPDASRPLGPGSSGDQVRGTGNTSERNRGSKGAGISNRGRERDRIEQEQLPERGKSQSER